MINLLKMCTSQSWGGMEMMVIKTCQALREKNIKISLVCYPQSHIHREAQNNRINCVPIPFINAPHPRMIMRLRAFLRKQRFDLLHTHFSRDLRFMVPAIEGLKPRMPILLTKRVGSYIKKKDLLHQYLYSRVDRVLAISNVIRQNVIDTCPVSPDKVQLHYNGLNLKKYKFDVSLREHQRQRLKYDNETCVIGMVGRFSPGKGHEDFIEGAKIINDIHPKVRFLIVGGPSHKEDSYHQQIIQMCKSLGLRNIIRFTGFQTNIPQLMSAMDILVFPSHAEAFGNVIIEAMAMYLPVVASRSDGVLDIARDGLNSLLFKPKDPRDLADKLDILIKNECLRHKLSQAGRQTVEANFDQEKKITELVEIYTEILENVNRN